MQTARPIVEILKRGFRETAEERKIICLGEDAN